jgi:hypothetical protein
MDDLFLLSEAQMRRIKPYFPLSHRIVRADDDCERGRPVGRRKTRAGRRAHRAACAPVEMAGVSQPGRMRHRELRMISPVSDRQQSSIASALAVQLQNVDMMREAIEIHLARDSSPLGSLSAPSYTRGPMRTWLPSTWQTENWRTATWTAEVGSVCGSVRAHGGRAFRRSPDIHERTWSLVWIV